MFEIKPAVRHAVPLIISLSGVSGSGKTYSALLLAAGLANGGKVGFLDTENGRGCMYSDSPGIKAALPPHAGSNYAGYETVELSAPFHPSRYVEVIDTFENAGYKVLVIDSASHAWSGIGGCTDIAEKDRGRWNNAKLANKRLVMRLLNSSMHVVVCLRAQEKSKIVKLASGKEETISLGILPISEKSFPFEMTLSFFMEEGTNLATQIKCPEPLRLLFPNPKLLTKSDGEKIRLWNDTGSIADAGEQIKKRARAAAEEGMKAYTAFYSVLSAPQKKVLVDSTHAENKRIAEEFDKQPKESDEEPEHFALLREMRGSLGDAEFFKIMGTNGFEDIEQVTDARAAAVIGEMMDALKSRKPELATK